MKWLVDMANKRLRSGFTTGTAAAAAAKAALLALLREELPQTVRIDFLSEGSVVIPVHRLDRLSRNMARATVIKDAGDDPDVTHRAEIGAAVTVSSAAIPSGTDSVVKIRGGTGVGRVTKPGLEVPPGEPAINSGPRRMIHAAVRQALGSDAPPMTIDVEVFVPDGVQLARKTLDNMREPYTGFMSKSVRTHSGPRCFGVLAP